MSTAGSRGRQRRSGQLPIRARVYIGATIAAALLAIPLAWTVDPVPAQGWIAVVVLSLLSISSSWGIRTLGASFSLSFSGIVLLAAVGLVGPVGAMVVAVSAYLLEFGHRPLIVRAFNMSMGAVVAAVAGWSYQLAHGVSMVTTLRADSQAQVPTGAGDILLQIGLPLLVADVTSCVLNVGLLGGIIVMTDDTTSWRRFVIGRLTSAGASYVGFGVVAFLLVVLWWPAQVSAFSAVLILAPLFVANYAFRQYAEENEAHERTIGALVTAVEVRDHFTRGHSERVARLAGMMADALGLTDREAQALRYAALLHDIGKLAVPMSVLRQASTPSPQDLALLALHPRRGVDMLGDIEFLEHSLSGILHHHERMDGRGYPAGLAGQAIPLFARIIAVADAFDSLTTERVDRPALAADAAVTELYRVAGPHLDPSLVVALERALRRHSWAPTTLDPSVLATAGRAFDHDDPAASELMAGLAERLPGSPPPAGGPSPAAPVPVAAPGTAASHASR